MSYDDRIKLRGKLDRPIGQKAMMCALFFVATIVVLIYVLVVCHDPDEPPLPRKPVESTFGIH